MGVVTYISDEIDEDNDEMVVTVLTRMGEQANSNRIMMNYAATRAAIRTGLKQRQLQAAAAEEHGLSWREGPFKKSPVQAFPESEEIEYEFSVVKNEEFNRTPLNETRFMHRWTVPLDMVM